MILTDVDFSKAALLYYDNPSCVSLKEFQDDLRRFNVLNRHLSNIDDWTPFNARKTINTMIIIYNLFGDIANDMLRYRVASSNLPRAISLSILLNKLTPSLGDILDRDTEFLEMLYEFS